MSKRQQVVLLFSILLLGACTDDLVDKPNSLPYEATVLGKGMDCGDTYLIELKGTEAENEVENDIYYAEDLPQNLKEIDLKIKLNCRLSDDDEFSICTARGFAYPHLIVTETKICEK